jgi:hypothetical protein
MSENISTQPEQPEKTEKMISIVKPRILGGTSIGITIPISILKELAKLKNVDISNIKQNRQTVNNFLNTLRGIWYKNNNEYIMKLKVIE